MKKIAISFLYLLAPAIMFAQKQTFDVVSFSIPQGWQQQQNEGGIQLSVTDKNTGAYAIAVITKAITSDKSADENFSSQWATLITSTVNVSSKLIMEDPGADNGWDILTGRAEYTDGPNKALATLVTATGYGQTASLVMMTNTQQYQKELLEFINSLQISKPSDK